MQYLFLDLRNTYHSLKKVYGQRVDLNKLKENINPDHVVICANYFKKANPFYTHAIKLGYVIEAPPSRYRVNEVQQRNSEVTMSLICKILEVLSDDFSVAHDFYIGSNDPNLYAFIKWLKSLDVGHKVILLTPTCDEDLLSIVDEWVRLDEEYLLSVKEEEHLGVSSHSSS